MQEDSTPDEMGTSQAPGAASTRPSCMEEEEEEVTDDEGWWKVNRRRHRLRIRELKCDMLKAEKQCQALQRALIPANEIRASALQALQRFDPNDYDTRFAATLAERQAAANAAKAKHEVARMFLSIAKQEEKMANAALEIASLVCRPKPHHCRLEVFYQ
jgi:hypothetical protein